MSKITDFWIQTQVLSPQSNVCIPNTVGPKSNFNVVVAVWMREGKPVIGQAWNESGVLKCSFAHESKVLGANELKGAAIHLLQSEINHSEKGFYYEWIPFNLHTDSKEMVHRTVVQCSTSIPLFWTEKMVIGYLDSVTGKAHFTETNGKYHELTRSEVASTKIEVLVRNFKGGPPGCNCVSCNAGKLSHQRKLMHYNEWEDIIEVTVLNQKKQNALVRAQAKPLATPNGNKDQIVVLWYLHGKPLMGRGWLHENKLHAIFVHKGKEYTERQLKEFQVLVQISAVSAGFEYIWMNYDQWNQIGDKSLLTLVQVGHVAPCVIFEGGAEILGSLDMDTEVAEGVVDGKCIKKEGGAIKEILILCRKDRGDIVAL